MTGALPELAGYRQWVCWKYEVVKGRETKVPYDPTTNRLAKSNDPTTWTDYDTAVTARGYDGIGFVVTADDPFVGVDLDLALDAEGNLMPWAEEIVLALNSYTEATPSKRGLRVWIKGKLPPGKRVRAQEGEAEEGHHSPAVEMYEHGRYFTITGHLLEALPPIIHERQEELNALHARLFPVAPVAPRPPSRPVDLDDRQILDLAFAARNGPEVMRLYDGHWEGGRYRSQSEADEALCFHLAFYTRDRWQIDRMFRASGLYRDKWDRPYSTGGTYGNRTIDAALSQVTEQYTPPTPRPPHPADVAESLAPAPPDRTPEALGDVLPTESEPPRTLAGIPPSTIDTPSASLPSGVGAPQGDVGALAPQEQETLLTEPQGEAETYDWSSVYNLAWLQTSNEAPPPQIVDDLISVGVTELYGHAKLGKAQPLDAPVLTPSGWRLMGEIQSGDLVVGANGLPTRVVAIHPQGEQPIYRLTFSDGSSAEASAEHLWLFRTRDQQGKRTPGRLYTTGETRDLMQRYPKRAWYLPLTNPVEFSGQQVLSVEPYLLGLLLGDGGLTVNVMFATRDEELIDRIAELLPAGVAVVRRNTGDVCLTGIHRQSGHRFNALRLALTEMGLMGKKSEEKWIPSPYLRATVAERFSLLQGLLDTDGGVEGEGVVFTSASKELAEDVRFLVEGLGGTAKLRVKWAPRYRYRGEERTGRPAYRIHIRLPIALGSPFRLARKRDKWIATRPTKTCPPTRRLVAIEDIGTRPAQCITVAATDGLYLTSHCVVTHNSFLALGIGVPVSLGGSALSHFTCRSGEVLYLAAEDARWRMKERGQHLLTDVPSWPVGFFIDHQFRSRMDGYGLRKIEAWLKARPLTKMIVLDPWHAFRRPYARGADIAAQDYDTFMGLNQLGMRHGCAILVVHHSAKSGTDDDINGGSGSHGLAAGAGTIIHFKRAREQHTAEMAVRGRDVRKETTYQLKRDERTGFWAVEGDAGELNANANRVALWEAMPQSGGLKPKELADLTGIPLPTVHSALKRMLMDGEAANDAGRYTRRRRPGMNDSLF